MAIDENTPSRRNDILAAAEQVFEAHGYAATTMDAVAHQAHIAKGSIYNYFRSKEELFEQVFAEAIGRLEADALKILAEPVSAKQRITRFLDYHCERLKDCKQISRLVLEFWATAAREQQGALAVNLKKMFEYWRERLAQILAEGAANGEFNLKFPPAFAAALLMALLDGIEVESLLGFGPELDEQYRSALKVAVLTALTAPKE